MSHQDEDFATLFAASEKTPAGARVRAGQSVSGTVVQIGRDAVFVDIGTRSEARIDRSQLSDAQGELKVQIGDRITATVAQAGDRPVLVVAFGGGSNMDLAALHLAQESGAPVEGKVAKAIKGGLEIEIGSRRCFCPASQVDLMFTKDLSVFEGQTMQFKIMEVREGGRTVVVSRRALLEAQRNESMQEKLSTLAVGATMQATVTSAQSYGAFVDLGGGLEGLVHISELGHGRVSNVTDVVNVGDTVQVQVLDISPGTDGKPRLRLSMKALQQVPSAASNTPEQELKVLPGVVSKVEPFGIFVTTEEGTGVVATRELDLPPNSDPRRAFPVGKKVEVVAMGIDPSGRRRYSMRRVEEALSRANYREFTEKNSKNSRGKDDLGSFGELLRSKLGSQT
jgi:small subunit ribosomal protein S1